MNDPLPPAFFEQFDKVLEEMKKLMELMERMYNTLKERKQNDE
jgi:hypothetical protein